MPWSFAIEYEKRDNGHRYHTLFDAGLYRLAKVRAFVDRHRRLLEAVAASPDATVVTLLSYSPPRLRNFCTRLPWTSAL